MFISFLSIVKKEKKRKIEYQCKQTLLYVRTLTRDITQCNRNRANADDDDDDDDVKKRPNNRHTQLNE